MIAYIALFSALLSRLTALAWGSTQVTSFIAHFSNIHRSGVLKALAWRVSHETAAISAQILCTPYNHAPRHFMQSHIRKALCVFSCNLPPALLAKWPGSFTCYCSNTGVERIPLIKLQIDTHQLTPFGPAELADLQSGGLSPAQLWLLLRWTGPANRDSLGIFHIACTRSCQLLTEQCHCGLPTPSDHQYSKRQCWRLYSLTITYYWTVATAQFWIAHWTLSAHLSSTNISVPRILHAPTHPLTVTHVSWIPVCPNISLDADTHVLDSRVP